MQLPNDTENTEREFSDLPKVKSYTNNMRASYGSLSMNEYPMIPIISFSIVKIQAITKLGSFNV